MRRVKLLFLLLGLVFSQVLSAQELSVSGKVTDTSGEPIPGVNVVIKGKNKGTSTNFNGKYQIKVNQGDVLSFSFIGYETVEKPVSKGGVLNVTLNESSAQLDKVVVTAMGIKKNEKALGYASQQIKVNDMKQINQNALANIQGQVSGVQITQSSGAVGGGVDILIRGVKSLDPSVSNQPLIVIDGVRMNNDIITGNVKPSSGSNAPNSADQFSFSNRGIDINPDDIASINVLKGAAASALYGIDAANGAIIITTKKGRNSAPSFTFTSRMSYSKVNKYIELQNKYREGWAGQPNITADPNNPNIAPVQQRDYGDDKGYWLLAGAPKNYAFHAWGPAYADDNDSSIKFHDFYKEFFKTGMGTDLNFSVRGGKEKYTYYMSLGRNASSGIIPNTDYTKTNFKIRSGYQLTKKFNVEVSATYANSGGKLPNNGDKSIMSNLSYFVPSFDINDYLTPDGRQKVYAPKGWIDNPRYFAETSNLQDNVDRIMGYVKTGWDIAPHFNLNYTFSVDTYSEARNRFAPPDLDVADDVGGFILNEKIKFNSYNSLLLAKYDYTLNEDMKFNFLAGNEVSKRNRDYDMIRGEGLVLPNFNNISNANNYFNYGYGIGRSRVGVFGEVDFAYKDKLFLTVTGRNDWSSTLPAQNRSFFYPSVNLSYILTDLLDKENKLLSFAKVRFSWANVGKDAPSGILGSRWMLGSYPTNSGSLLGGIYPSSVEGDLNLKPENQRTTEFGFDFRFLNNRIRLDYTYYNNLNTDLIARIPVSNTSGRTSIWTNAGSLLNKGHEVLLSGKWIDKKDFSLSSTINWSTNKGKVMDLPDGIESIIYASSGYPGIMSMVKEGDAPGTLYGYTWKYNENGDRIIDASDYKPRIDTDEKVIVGNAFPDWVASLQNTVTYKNLSFGFLLEYKKGGDAYDSGQRNAIRGGTLPITLERDVDVVLEGVVDDGNGGWVENTTPTHIDQGYYRSSTRYNRAAEILIQDASWVKLRNISLSYSLPSKWLNKAPFSKVQFNVVGANFLLWTPFRGFDPEGNQFSAGSNTYGFTGLSTPLTKSYSFGVKVEF